MNARHEVYFVFEEPLDAGAGELEVRMRHDQNENYLVGRFRLSVAELAPPAGPLDDGERKAVEAAVEKAAGDRSGEEKALLAAVFRRIDPVQGGVGRGVGGVGAGGFGKEEGGGEGDGDGGFGGGETA